MKAAFGFLLVAGFFALAAGLFAAAFFIGLFFAAGFLAAGFFAGDFLDFLAAIENPPNLLTLPSVIPPLWRDSERMHKAKTPCQPFSLEASAFSL
ncbi:MAG: hypothetical protein ABIR98_08910 [Usitatibacter sp.]